MPSCAFANLVLERYCLPRSLEVRKAGSSGYFLHLALGRSDHDAHVVNATFLLSPEGAQALEPLLQKHLPNFSWPQNPQSDFCSVLTLDQASGKTFSSAIGVHGILEDANRAALDGPPHFVAHYKNGLLHSTSVEPALWHKPGAPTAMEFNCQEGQICNLPDRPAFSFHAPQWLLHGYIQEDGKSWKVHQFTDGEKTIHPTSSLFLGETKEGAISLCFAQTPLEALYSWKGENMALDAWEKNLLCADHPTCQLPGGDKLTQIVSGAPLFPRGDKVELIPVSPCAHEFAQEIENFLLARTPLLLPTLEEWRL